MKLSFLSATKIANSGQIFRAYIKENEVHFLSGSGYAIIKRNGEVICTNEEYFTNFFDLSTDYNKINKALVLNPEIIVAGDGIRILNGDFNEIVISFIISANNNIKRIRKTVEQICEKYGEQRTFNKTTYYTFPTLDQLSTATEVDFAELGCGYRAPYLIKTIAELKNMSFDELNKLPNDVLYKKLTALHGVGPKVAACIMLFAFHRLDVYPVDTWIKKAKNILTAHPYAGVAQQYLFYYLQHLKKEL